MIITNLNSVCVDVASKHARKRVGRGIGSGNGKTSGRGHKGNGARSGRKFRLMFEGGQTPFPRRVAKRGFNGGGFADPFFSVTIEVIARCAVDGDVLGRDFFDKLGARNRNVKVYGKLRNATFPSVNLQINKISAGAEKIVLSAGGAVTII